MQSIALIHFTLISLRYGIISIHFSRGGGMADTRALRAFVRSNGRESSTLSRGTPAEQNILFFEQVKRVEKL